VFRFFNVESHFIVICPLLDAVDFLLGVVVNSVEYYFIC
jgi:hypothetical protein